HDEAPARTRGDLYPSLAQVAGHVMNSIFLDSLAVDLERLERINRTISCTEPEQLRRMGLTLHHVDVLVLTPSEALDAIAVKHVRSLPASIRFLMRSVGAMRRAEVAAFLGAAGGARSEPARPARVAAPAEKRGAGRTAA